MLKLDFRTDLPKIRAAYDAGQLQAQKPDNIYSTASYSGPCAVGCIFDEETRRLLDESALTGSGYGVTVKAERGEIEITEGQEDEWRELQAQHDRWMYRADQEHADAHFVQMLQILESKYGTGE